MDIERLLYWIHEAFGTFIFYYMIIIISVYTLMLIFAFMHLKKSQRLDKNIENNNNLKVVYSKPVSVIVPVFNEETGIKSTIHSLLTLEYPNYEIIIVNDGSKDHTLDVVIKEFEMEKVFKTVQQKLETEEIQGIYRSKIHHNIILVDKKNGGKADALNAGINISSYPYFCSIDGDSILASKSLLQVMQPIIASNGQVIAAGGSIRIANESDVHYGKVMNTVLPNNPLIIMQIIEYVRAFYMGRIALSRFNLVLIISGAFSVFSKEYVMKVGGYSKKTIGEDMEIIVRLHRYILKNKLDKKIEFISDPVCWTEAPDNLRDLRIQRRRWYQGLISSIFMNLGMLFNPRYKQIGLVSMPYFLFIELIGPMIELLGYVYVIISLAAGNMYIVSAITLLILFLIYTTVISMYSILLESWSMNTYPRVRDTLKLLLYSLTEIFWFRPLLLIYRLQGIFYFIIQKNDWGSLKRNKVKKDMKELKKIENKLNRV